MCECQLSRILVLLAQKGRTVELPPTPTSTSLNDWGNWAVKVIRMNGIDADYEGHGRIVTAPKGLIRGYPEREVVVVLQIKEIVGNDPMIGMSPRWSYDEDTASHEAAHVIAKLLAG